jgi:hypothetical protein
MADPNTLRILEIDGGGERGILPLKFLQLFVQGWGIEFEEIYKYFDVICGTSIGGILALSLAQGGHSYDGLRTFFTVQGPYIFTLYDVLNPILLPSNRPSGLEKFVLVLDDIPFYQSSSSSGENTEDDGYGAGLLYKTIRDNFGRTATIQDLKTNVVIPSYCMNDSRYVMFSNVNSQEFIGQTALISDVALSTSAAPFYLPFYKFNDENGYLNYFADGGLYQNNPAAFGRNIGQIVKPNATRTCILSIGTGLGEMGFDPGTPAARLARTSPGFMKRYKKQFNKSRADDDPPPPYVEPSLSSLFKNNVIFSIASTGAQESIAQSLYLASKYGCPTRLYQYRFQPLLDPTLNTELDNTDSDILDYYEQTAQQGYDNDTINISKFLAHLTA